MARRALVAGGRMSCGMANEQRVHLFWLDIGGFACAHIIQRRGRHRLDADGASSASRWAISATRVVVGAHELMFVRRPADWFTRRLVRVLGLFRPMRREECRAIRRAQRGWSWPYTAVASHELGNTDGRLR